MKAVSYTQGLTLLWPSVFTSPLRVPLYSDQCAAGFPSHAQNYVGKELDLNELCKRRRTSTFFERASDSIMQELGLCDGDVMVADHAVEASHGDIVIAQVNGGFTVKRLQLQPRLALLPMNPAYSINYPKEWSQFRGVMALTEGNPKRTATLLENQPVEVIWGVGRRIGKRLNLMGIHNALQLARTHPALIRKNFSVVLERTVRELNGDSCIPIEELPPAQQQICCSRSFGERITSKVFMQQALCQYATRAAEKLRGERQFCRHISVFVRTSPHAVNEVFYSNSAGEKLSLPTQDTRDIIEVAMRSLDRIWLEGRRYMKAGIMLDDFTPDGVSQLSLFDNIKPRVKSPQLMKVIDGINQSGLGNVWFAVQGINTEWRMKREMLSPSWTTRWSDIPVARVI